MPRARRRDEAEYALSPPRKVRGGIRAASRRGEFARTWWSRRWIQALEALPIGARLARGKRYARAGQVLDIQIREGLVEARVQGSRATPYRVRLALEPLPPDVRGRIARRIAADAALAAELLAGRIPETIEEVFAREGASLFPEVCEEKGLFCSCPDWSVPCKHTAAVFYLLGEAFDADPFLILTLRGLTRERLLEAVRSGSGGEETRGASLPEGEELEGDEAALSGGGTGKARGAGPVRPPLNGSFFDAGPLPDEERGIHPPLFPAPDLRRLGPFPLWRGEEPLLETLLPAYERAVLLGLELRRGPVGPEVGGEPERSGESILREEADREERGGAPGRRSRRIRLLPGREGSVPPPSEAGEGPPSPRRRGRPRRAD